MMHSRPTILCRHRLAMTLVEVLVAGGILTVVLGIAFGMIIESQTASRSIARRQTALQTSEMAMRLALEKIEGAVHPSAVGASLEMVPPPVFSSDAISFTSYADGGGTLNSVSIKQTSETIELQTRPLGSSAPAAVTPLVRAGDDSFSLSIGFAYAGVAQPGMPPAYRDSAGPTEWPDLVRVTVTASPKGGGQPLVLQSAATPGAIVNKNKQPELAPASTSPTLAAPAAAGATP